MLKFRHNECVVMVLRHRLRVRALIALATAAQVVAIVFGVAVMTQSTPAMAAQSVPYKVNFQGRLTDNSGNVLADGLYNIKFRLWNASSGGANQWEAARVRGASDYRVQVTNGLFNIQFGDTALGDPAITPALFNTGTGTLYLEVELPTPATATCATNACAVFTEGPMTPRQPLASSPYAINSDALDGLDSSAFVQLSVSQQTGSINVSGNIQTAAALQGATATLSGASSLTVGTSESAAGAIIFKNSTNTNTVTLTVGATAANYSLNLPLNAPGTAECLKTDAVTATQLVFGSCAAGGAGANTALSNLASVAINTSLLPGVTNSIDAGSSSFAFRSGYFATSVLTPGVDTVSAGALTLGGTTATSIALADDTVLGADKSLTFTGGATRPSSPTAGMLFYDTGINQLLQYNGTKWQADRSTATKIVGTSASGGASSAVASQSPDGADFINTSTTSAQTVINSAISALPAAGGTVYLMEGTYIVDGNINLPSNVRITGAGEATILKIKDGISGDVKVFTNANQTTGNSNISLDSLKLDGNRSNRTSGSQVGIEFITNGSGTHIGNVSVRNVTFASFYYAGIYSEAYDATFDRNRFYDSDYGFQAEGGDRVKFTNNTVEVVESEAVVVNNSQNSLIQGNTIRQPSGPSYVIGLDIGSSTDGTIIADNIFENIASYSIFVFQANNLTIRGNIIRNGGGSSSSSAIDIDGPADRINITGNTITDTAGSGYAIKIAADVTNAYLADNIYSGTGAASISDASTSTISAGQLSGTNQNIFSAPGALATRLQSGASNDLFQAQDSSGNALLAVGSTGTLTLGRSSNVDGTIVLKNASNANTVTLSSGATGASYSLTLPTAAPGNSQCLQSGAVTASQLTFGACGSGASTTLNNLGTTSINADLLPSANNARSIGSATLVWANMYAANLDAGTTSTALTVGTAATTTAITIGRSGVAVSLPGGLTTSNGTINTGSGSITTTGAIGGGAITGTSLATSGNGTINSGSGTISTTGALSGGTVAGTTSVTSPSFTGTGAVSLSSGAASALTLDSTNGTLLFGSNTTTLQKAASAFTIDLATAGTAQLNILNSNGANVTNLVVDGTIGAGTITGTSLATSGNGTINSGSGSISTTGALNGGTIVGTTSVTSPSYTGTGAVTVSSGGSAALTLDSASGNLIIGSSTTAIQKAVTAFAIDLATASTSTLTVRNSNGANVANLVVTGTIGGGAITGTSLATSGNGTINSGSGSITTTGAVNAGTVVASTSVSSPTYTGAGAVTLQSGGTAQNILLNPSTTGKVQVGGTTPFVTTSGATALTVDTGGAAALNLGNSSASSVNIGNSTAATQVLINGGTNATNAIGLTAAANGGILATTTGTGNIELNSASSIIAQSTTNSATAFQVQNSSSAPIFMVDTTTTNLITNPGFETNITGWTGGGTGATVAQNLIKTNVYNGLSSLRVNTATSGSTTATVNGFTSSLAAGNYNFSFYANASVNVAGLTISFTGGGGTCTPNATTIVTGGFSRYSCSVTTTGTTTAIVVTVTTTSATLYIDAVQLTSGATLMPYSIGGIQLRGVITNPVVISPTSDSQTAFQVTNGSGTRVLSVDTESATDAIEVQIGSSTSIDAVQINLGLDSSSTFAEAGGSCGVSSGQGALYYNTAMNVIRGCVGGNWEDMVSTAGLGLQLFGVVPDTGTNPGDLAGVSAAINGPCKVSVGATTSTVSWTGCTAYSGGRKIIVTAGTAASATGAANTWQHLCLTGTNSQPALSARSTEVANLATVSMPSVTAPILCLADIRTNTNNNTTINVVYDTRTYTTSLKEMVSIGTTAPALGHLVQYTTTRGVVQPMATANGNGLAGVVVATTGAISTNTINGIIAVSGPAAVKAITGTNTVGAYLFGTTTAGYAGGVATKPTEGTGTIYNVLGIFRTAWTGATACAINSDACAGSVLTSIDKR